MDNQTSRAVGVFVFGHTQEIKDLTVTYVDGSTVSGFVKEASLTDWAPRITLCKHSAGRNESPYVPLDFNEIQSLVVTLRDGTIQRF